MKILYVGLPLVSVLLALVLAAGCRPQTDGGDGSTADTDPKEPSAARGSTICLEAEDAEILSGTLGVGTGQDAGTTEWPAIDGASGGRYLQIPQGAGKPPENDGRARLQFEVRKAGTYQLWARVWWLDGCGNSIGFALNGSKSFTFGQDASYGKWHWVQAPRRLQQLELEPGIDVLEISAREDGVAVDQILLTLNRRYVPVGVEESANP